MMRRGFRLCLLTTPLVAVTSFVSKLSNPSHRRGVGGTKEHYGFGSHSRLSWRAGRNSKKNWRSPLRSVMVNTTEHRYSSPYTLDDDFELELELQREQFELLLQQTQSELLFVEPQEEYMDAIELPETSDAITTTEKNGLFGDVWNARLLLLGAAALYGTNFSIVKILGDSMPVGFSSTLRFGMAAIATLPWLITAPEKENDETRDSFLDFPQDSAMSSTMAATTAGLEVGMWTSIGYVAQAVGLETTDASKSAFICSLAVVIVPILDVMAGKRLLPREVIGAFMAVAGVGLLEGFFSSGGADMTLACGDICSLVQPLAFGMGFWRMEHAMRKFPESADRLTAAQLLAVFVASASYCAVTPMMGIPLPAPSQITSWLTDPIMLGALFWTGVVTTALTVYMETLALKTLSAAETTLIFSTEPLWGAGCAALLMGEHFGPEAALGAGLILAGCVVSNIGSGFFDNKLQESTNIESSP